MWKRSERAIWDFPLSGGDNKEADHSTVNCVGLFGADSRKDDYSCKDIRVDISFLENTTLWGCLASLCHKAEAQGTIHGFESHQLHLDKD